MPIRVLIVDDQSLIRSGLRSVLADSEGIVVVGEAADGAEAISAARGHQPDVVLLDLHMPHISGVEATPQLLRLEKPPRVLVLTTFTTDDLVIQALNAGASGFLLKDLSGAELTAAVRTAAAGGTVTSPEIMTKLVSQAQSRTTAGSDGMQEKIASLTESEREVLALIGAGHTNQQIAETLHLSLASVKTYASRMLNRLGLDNRTQAAVLAYQAGMVTSPGTGVSSDRLA